MADYPAEMRTILEKYRGQVAAAERALSRGQFDICRAELRLALATVGEAQNLREGGAADMRQADAYDRA